MVGAVFGAEAKTCLVYLGGDGSEMGEGHADDYVTLGILAGEGGIDLLGEGYSFRQVGVHLPVACYDFLSHFSYVC